MADDFDPSSLPRYSVIQVPYRYQGGHSLKKLFVVIAHQAGHAICLKATSQIELYRNSKELMAGAVCYEAGKVSFLLKDTVIQPDNQVPVSYDHLRRTHKTGGFQFLGQLPDDFREQLVKAATASVTLTPSERKRLLHILGG